MPPRPVPYNSLGQIIVGGAVQQVALRLAAGDTIGIASKFLSDKYSDIPQDAIDQIIQYAAEGVVSAGGVYTGQQQITTDASLDDAVGYLKSQVAIDPQLSIALQAIANSESPPQSLSDVLGQYPDSIPTVPGITGSSDITDRLSIVTIVDNVDNQHSAPVFTTALGDESFDNLFNVLEQITSRQEARYRSLADYLGVSYEEAIRVFAVGQWKEY